ncbi:MAG: hypothetical protein KAH95_17305 [Spirochaetales bacterium]|nr:hypothetical protein [Spirochaetales bacterium]
MKKILLVLTVLALIGACEMEQPIDDSFGMERLAVSIHDMDITVDVPHVLENLDSAEYKIIINLEDYDPALLWEIMREAADKEDIRFEQTDDPMEPGYRQIQYIDSDSAEIYRGKGYVVRYRQKFDDYFGTENPLNELDEKYDITLKYGHNDFSVSEAIPMFVGERFIDLNVGFEKDEAEIEADISPAGIKYTKSLKVKEKVEEYGAEFADLFEPTIESYATLYPQLLEIGLDSDINPIGPIGGKTLLETKIEPGVLLLKNGLEMEVALSLFQLDGEDLAAEVSFDFDTEYENKDGADVKMTAEDFAEIEEFYRTLLLRYNHRIGSGSSKTALTYAAVFDN